MKIFTLHAAYKDNDPENLGVFRSGRAAAAALAVSVLGDHPEEPPEKVAKRIGKLVFDFATICRFEPERDECRDGKTVYGCDENDVEDDEEDEE